jgi:hypothetical protein
MCNAVAELVNQQSRITRPVVFRQWEVRNLAIDVVVMEWFEENLIVEQQIEVVNDNEQN